MAKQIQVFDTEAVRLFTSAKNSKNINSLFTEIVRQMNIQPIKDISRKNCCQNNCIVL